MKTEIMKYINLIFFSLIPLLMLLATLGSCSEHPSAKYEYYDKMKRSWIPAIKGKLICGDTSFIAYEMAPAQSSIHSIWYITSDGYKISWSSSCAFMEIEKLPSFRNGERLNDFQLRYSKVY